MSDVLLAVTTMFYGIKYHCDRCESWGDIVTDLESLDLSKYLSPSNDSHIWWAEMNPVLRFAMWFEECIKDSVSVFK